MVTAGTTLWTGFLDNFLEVTSPRISKTQIV